MRQSAACYAVQSDGLTETTGRTSETIRAARSEWVRLVNETEAASKRRDSQICIKYQWSLPDELSPEGCDRVTAAMARQLSVYSGSRCRALVAQHRPDDARKGTTEYGNRHCHAVILHRDLNSGKMVREFSDRRAGRELRQLVERMINAELEHEGSARRIDARSYRAQGRDQAPGRHRGPWGTVRDEYADNLARLADCVGDGALDSARARPVLDALARKGARIEAQETKRHGRNLYLMLGTGKDQHRYKVSGLAPEHGPAWRIIREWMLQEQARQRRERGLRRSAEALWRSEIEAKSADELRADGWRATQGRDGRRWLTLGPRTAAPDAKPVWLPVTDTTAGKWEALRRPVTPSVLAMARVGIGRALVRAGNKAMARGGAGAVLAPLLDLRPSSILRRLTR
jgi:hypothetical protein